MKKKLVLVTMLFVLMLPGCGQTGETKADAAVVEEKTAEVAASPEETASVEAQQPSPEASEAPALVLPVVGNDTGKTLIQTVSASETYPFTSYIITSANGESVVIDPTEMPAPSVVEINPAAILSTHDHPDHTDSAYVSKYEEVPKLYHEEGELQTKDFEIYTIASSHKFDKIDGGNLIIVMEVDGLRIAHMGDIGQTALTDEQMLQLGQIDIAFMQFDNSYSAMSLENEKGFGRIAQVNPKIIIPTHYTEDCNGVFTEKYGEVKEFDNILEITKDELPETNMNMYKILNSHTYK